MPNPLLIQGVYFYILFISIVFSLYNYPPCTEYHRKVMIVLLIVNTFFKSKIKIYWLFILNLLFLCFSACFYTLINPHALKIHPPSF